jgi:hypothetical protein
VALFSGVLFYANLVTNIYAVHNDSSSKKAGNPNRIALEGNDFAGNNRENQETIDHENI